MQVNPSEKKPEIAFSDILKHPKLLENITVKLGFTKATPIQVAVADPIREGRNLFAGAKTGSGKTIAFLAPLAERMFDGKVKMALVLAPTRELVLQIDEEAMSILDGQTEVVSVPLYGGVPVDGQVLALRTHRPRLLIATPGRILDLIQEGVLNLGEIQVAVLDEADRMCDMGFAPQVTQILDLLHNRIQTLCFSATLPKELNEIMGKFCPEAVRVQVDAADSSSETIEHTAIFVSRHDKMRKLMSIITAPGVTSLVFTRTRNRCDQVHRAVAHDMRDAGILHAGYSMPERERTIRNFREQKIRCLIATDVVARGIDVEHITHVIHFDIPDQLEDYIHRSGRSGRAGRTGETIALFDPDSREEMAKFKSFGQKIHFEIGDAKVASEGRSSGHRAGPREDSRHRGNGRDEPRRNNRGGSGRGRGHSEEHAEGAPRRAHAGTHSRTDSKRTHSQQNRRPSEHRPHPAAYKPLAKKEGLLQKTKNIFKNFFGS